MKPEIKCTDCHNTIAHDQVPPIKNYPTLEKCLSCHNGQTASAKCDLCHRAKAAKPSLPDRWPWSVTHGPTWRQTHGMGNLNACSACHAKEYCQKCHQIEMPHPYYWKDSHGKVAAKTPTSCTQCHTRSACQNCHQIEMPHPTDWLKNHSSYTRLQGKKLCSNCHYEESCDRCHRQHIHPAIITKR